MCLFHLCILCSTQKEGIHISISFLMNKTKELKEETFSLNEVFERDYRSRSSRITVTECPPSTDQRGLYRILALNNIRAGECLFVERALVYSSAMYTLENASCWPSLRNFLLFGSTAAELKRELTLTGLLNGLDRPQDGKSSNKGKAQLNPRPPVVPLHSNNKVASNWSELFNSLEMNLLRYLQETFPGNEKKQRDFLNTYHVSSSVDRETVSLHELATAVVIANSIPLRLGASLICYANGFFPTLMRMNHSCESNSFVMGHGRYNLLFASRDIKAGEEVTMSYSPYTSIYPCEHRSRLIAEQFSFKCLCTRCEREKTKKALVIKDDASLFYFSEMDSATFIRHLAFGKLPEFAVTSPCNSSFTTDRSREYQLLNTYLDQHAQRLTILDVVKNDDGVLKLHSYVTEVCARLLALPTLAIAKTTTSDWSAVFKKMQPLMKLCLRDLSSATGDHWTVTPALSTLQHFAGKLQVVEDVTFLTKNLQPAPLALSTFCLQQHLYIFE